MAVCKCVYGAGRFVAADATEFRFYLLHCVSLSMLIMLSSV